MLITNNQSLFNHVQKLTKYIPPHNYSEFFKYSGEEYIYMSSVDPHHHRGEFPEFDRMWTVVYNCIDTDFRFVYYNVDNELVVQEVELGVPYTFNAHKRHAVIRKDLVEKFDNRYYWRSVWKPENELRMIFKIIDYKGE